MNFNSVKKTIFWVILSIFVYSYDVKEQDEKNEKDYFQYSFFPEYDPYGQKWLIKTVFY